MTAQDNPDARVVRVEVEVSGTPEEVWEAIATGPGLECWFVPAKVEGREGGTIKTDHGPFGESTGTVTAWEPPHRFAYEERDWHPDRPDPPPWATEILVEALTRSPSECAAQKWPIRIGSDGLSPRCRVQLRARGPRLENAATARA